MDPEGEFSETDLLALYHERYPSAPKTRQEQRGVCLHTRRLDALRRLQSLVVEAPVATHALSGWFEPSVAVRLNAAGLVTLQQLIDGINVFGERWYTRIKGLGRERAGRIVRWIESHAPSLGALSARASAPLRSVSRDVLFAERIPTGGVTPLEVMDVPHELSGSDGANRALQERNQTGAIDDLGAIRAWLALHESTPHTWRAYRTQAERILLWAVLERRKPLSSLDVADITAYRSFLANVPDKWIGECRTPR